MARKYKILLIEDEPELVELFSTALKRAGFEVEVIEDGSNALDLVKSLKPDLVLLDLIIPKKDGYEVLREIKGDKSVSQTLVYIFSNLTQKDEIEKAMKLGAKDYLIKSDYTPSKLVDKINKIFPSNDK
ncbi:MAG: response regulator [Candidatus Buchananbacteria bacterium]|nr:response regulator [Candidatus Buchananbacteria bacterium]